MPDRAANTPPRRIADRNRARFTRQIELLLQLLTRINDRDLEAAILTRDLTALPWLTFDRQTQTTIRDVLTDILEQAGRATVPTLPFAYEFAFNRFNPFAVEWAEQHVGRLIVQISRETETAIRSIISRALREGADVPSTARQVREIVGLHTRWANAVQNRRALLTRRGLPGDRIDREVARYAGRLRTARARAIARTELLSASNKGQRLLWDDAVREGLLDPTSTRIRWLCADPCPLCAPMCNETVGFSESFRFTEKGLGDGVSPLSEAVVTDQPPRHPSCRCALALEL